MHNHYEKQNRTVLSFDTNDSFKKLLQAF